MRGRERNSAFFKQGKEDVESTSASGGLQRLYKTARETGKLTLSGRSLSSIPDIVFTLSTTLDEGDKFWEVNPLTRLDLSSNVLKDIPSGNFHLIRGDLTYLNLKDNKLQSLPADVFACNLLKYLNLSINELRDVSDSIGELTDLKELFLSNNKLATVPASLSYCKSLQAIELQNNVLTKIPPESLNLPQLLKLNLSSNKLTEIPSSISGLTLLESLDISKNKITFVPDLSNMRCLRLLSASENRISLMPTLPAKGQLDRVHIGENLLTGLDISALVPSAGTLTELLVQGNQLSDCPDSIFALSSLKILDISNNSLTNLPHALGYMPSLSKILVEGNPIRTIRRTLLSSPVAEELKIYLRTRGPPPVQNMTGGGQSVVAHQSSGKGEIEDAWQASYKTAAGEHLQMQLQHRVRDGTGNVLDLSGLGISSDHMTYAYKQIESSHSFLSLVSLDLSTNSISSFPSILHSLSNLKKLILASNALGSSSSFDLEAYRFPPSLTHLDVSSNKLTTRHLDDILTALNDQSLSLSALLASSNRISEIPKSILQQNKLRETRFSVNQICTLKGVQFNQLKFLEILDLSNNKIPVLDVLFPTSMRSLLLSNNNIVDLPVHLTALCNLQTLQLTGNPIKNIRSEVISQGADAILLLLKNRQTVTAPSKPLTGSNQSTAALKGAVPKAQPGWDNSCDSQEDVTPTATASSSYKSQGDAAPCLDNRSKGYGVEKMREMAVQTAQSQTKSYQSRSGQPQPPSHNLAPRSNGPSSAPPPAPSTRPDPKALASEIAQLEYEMENCSNAVKRLQIRKNIATKRAIMLGPM